MSKKTCDQLIIGERYHLWRDGKYLGQASYVIDEIMGESFILPVVDEKGKLLQEVYVADFWTRVR